MSAEEPLRAPTTRDPAPWVVVKALVVGAVVAGTVFRFTTRSALWLDEALSVNIASLPPAEIFEALRHDGHPPLYYLLLHGWMQVFGSGDVAVRALSAVFGLASIPLMFVAGRRRGGPLLGWLAVGVLAASPFAIRYGTEVRMYTLVSFLTLVGYLLVDDVIRRERHDLARLAGIAVVTGLLLLTHYWALWLVGAVGLICLWEWRRSQEPNARPGALRVLLAMAVGSLGFVWWLPTMLYQSAHTGTPWSSPVRPSVTASNVLIDFGAGTNFPDAPFLAVIGSLLFALGVFGTPTGRFRISLDLRSNRQLRFEAMVTVLTLGIGIAVGFAAQSAFASRYASVLFPFFVLIVAAGISRFEDRRIQAAVFAVLLLASGLGAVYNAFIFQRTQVADIAAEIDVIGRPGDVVVFCPDQLGPSGVRALSPGYDAVSFPTLGDPRFVDWVDYGERNDAVDPAAVGRQVLERAGDDHAIFVVWSGSYRTLEQKCESMIATISDQRPTSRTLVDSQPEKYYEHATLSWFGPTAPPPP